MSIKMGVLSLKTCCLKMLVKYENEEDAALLWIELPVMLQNTLLSMLMPWGALSYFATLNAYFRLPDKLTFVNAYPALFYNSNGFRSVLDKYYSVPRLPTYPYNYHVFYFYEVLLKIANMSDICLIRQSPNMLTFVKAYPEKYYNADAFQSILLKAADMGDIRLIKHMLQTTPYRPHPETMQRVLSKFRRRCKKTRRNEIYTIVHAWLNTSASSQPARRDMAEFDISGFDYSLTCAGLCGV